MGDAAAEAINKRLDEIAEQLDRLLASFQLHARPSNPKSLWLPLPAAAEALRFSSPKALRGAIDRGTIPPNFVRDTNEDSSKRRRLLVDVEGYALHLRHK
jgi:hypothetical protein